MFEPSLRRRTRYGWRMPNADFFAQMGFFVVRGFLPPDACARVRSDVAQASRRPATVRADAGEYDVDRRTRSTDLADVSPETLGLIEERLGAVMPDVARYYGTPLSGWQTLQFLVYREGDFFHPHRDRADDEEAASFSRARRVAAVVFLNAEGDAGTDGYRGGALTFYDLFDRPDAETLGFPLEPEVGLLMTFPTHVVHEVRPVEAGERNTIVTWFVGESAGGDAGVQASGQPAEAEGDDLGSAGGENAATAT
jgi:predicted 2-oxoglutarate/Fe(II)-dependent dioxygenase YbiX